MKLQKLILLMLIFSIILLLSNSYLTLDWTLLRYTNSKISVSTLKYSEIAKLTLSFLCASIVFLIGNDGYNKEDTISLQKAFIVIFMGDLLFFFHFEYIAVVFFCISHVLLIIRNGAGIKVFFRASGLKSRKYKVIFIAVGSLLIYMSIIVFIFYPELHDKKLLYFVIGYAFLLCSSLWIAWSSIIIGYMPPINAVIIAVGMSFFFLCDLTVGINFCFNDGLLKTIAPYIIWTFYTPALVLISFSGYNISKAGLS